jgi:hypothetical protein
MYQDRWRRRSQLLLLHTPIDWRESTATGRNFKTAYVPITNPIRYGTVVDDGVYCYLSPCLLTRRECTGIIGMEILPTLSTFPC